MHTRELVVASPHGIHMRVAAKVVYLVKKYSSSVRLFDRNNQNADGQSILGILSLGIEKGSPVRLEITGPDEEKVANDLVELFSDGSGI